MTNPKPHDYRFVLSARWLRYIAFALILVVVCLLLSNWQNHRREARNAEIANIEKHYNAAPVPLHQAVGSTDTKLSASEEWTHVRASGHYDVKHTVLARNRSQDGSPGYYVVVPLRTQQGTTIPVVRGFLPTTDTGSIPSLKHVPAPASGKVTVTMWLRQSQDGSKDDNPAGTISAIDPRNIPGMKNPYWHVYGQLDAEAPAAGNGLHALPKPSIDPGSHLSYQLQWIAFGVMIIIGVVYAAVRERKNRAEAKRLAQLRAASASATGGPGDGAAGGDVGTDQKAGNADGDGMRVIDKEALRSGAKMSAEGGRYGDSLAGSSEAVARLSQRKKTKDEDAEDAWLDQQGF